MKIRVDFFRAETMATLKTVREYLATMEDQLNLLRETKEALIRTEAKCWEDLDVDLREFKIVFNEIFPRCLRYSFVVFLYSVMETQLDALCNEIRKRRGLPEELRDKRTPLERCKDFISKSFGIDFGKTPTWEALTVLEKVRDCIAHTGGRVEDSRDRDFLEIKAKAGIGLAFSDHSISKGRIIVEHKFCADTSDAAISFFGMVFERTGFGPETMQFEA